jgi:K+-sensing histidine kinase KdpD
MSKENEQKFIELFLSKTHNLRSPVASMKSFINILELQEFQTNPDELKELVQHLEPSFDRWFSLFEELFTVANSLKEEK